MSLKDFINAKKKELKILKKSVPLSELKERLKTAKKTRDFLKVFNKGFIVIAEIKKASPSEGIISENVDIAKVARAYMRGGASIISVLTDKNFFNGDISYLSKVSKTVSLPVLRKDFIIDEYQVYESRFYGADAILLIVGALSNKKLSKLIDLAYHLKMECIVEIHDEKELERILEIPKIKIIGVNNRNLDTLKTDLNVIENLIDKIPKDKLVISESGVKNRDDVLKVRRLGVNGILVGTSLMKSKNKVQAIKELLI